MLPILLSRNSLLLLRSWEVSPVPVLHYRLLLLIRAGLLLLPLAPVPLLLSRCGLLFHRMMVCLVACAILPIAHLLLLLLLLRMSAICRLHNHPYCLVIDLTWVPACFVGQLICVSQLTLACHLLVPVDLFTLFLLLCQLRMLRKRLRVLCLCNVLTD